MAKSLKKEVYVITAEYTPHFPNFKVAFIREDLEVIGYKKIKVVKKDG